MFQLSTRDKIAWLGSIVLVVGIIILILFHTAKEEKVKKEAAQAAGAVATGQANAAKDAIGTVSEAGKREGEVDSIGRETAGEIAGSDGAKDAINPTIDAVAIRRLCLRDVNRCQSTCERLLGPCSK